MKSKLLRIIGTTPTATVCAGCLWRKHKTSWKADKRACAPILLWMVGKSSAFVLAGLQARGWDYEWLDVADRKNPPGGGLRGFNGGNQRWKLRDDM